jgi:drug/metabolite transporter (DMT)-like permease
MRETAAPLLSRLEAGTQSTTWGIFFMVAGTLIIPAMDAIAKILGETISPLQVTWGRFFFQALIMAIAIIAVYGPRSGFRLLLPKRPLVHAVRGLLIAVATTFFFFSLLYLPLADSIAIFFVQPMLLTLLSAIFLGETIGWHRKAAVIIGFLGVLLIIKPGSESFTIAALLPIASALFFSGYLVVTRAIANIDHPMTMQFASGVSATVAISVGLIPGTFVGSELWGAQPPTSLEWTYLAAIGLIAAGGHLLVIIAVNRAPTSVLAPFGYVEIIAATLLGWLIFGDWPDTYSWLGIAIIIASGMYVFVREQHAASIKSS